MVSSSISDEGLSKSDLLDADSSPQTPSELVHVDLVFEKSVHEIGSKDNFRVEYLRRLSSEKVWVPPAQRSPKYQSLIIFDWDDTLMYTSFLLHGMQRKVSEATNRQLENIEKAARNLLETALGLGHTFIITNAQKGWVEDCVERYMPSLKDVLQKVPIISARSTQEAYSPNLSHWKKRAFLEVGRQLNKEMITNLVSIGDSNYEMEAVHLLGQEFSRSLVKTVKLQESPTPEELMKELDLIVPKLQKIVDRAVNMTVRLERKAR